MTKIGVIDGSGGGMPPGLAQLLADALGGEDESKDAMTPTDMVAALRDAKGKLDTEYTFEPGQVLRRKSGVEDGYKQPRGGVIIYLRKLTDEERDIVRAAAVENHTNDHAFVASSRDCLCLRLAERGAALEFPATERHLEPHPDFL